MGNSEAQKSSITLVFFERIKLFASLVKFSHTIFALPFALSMFVIVMQKHSVTSRQLILILLALVSARTAAMAFNRFLDRRIDAKNARTMMRELPSGLLSERQVMGLFLIMIIVFHIASALLGLHCLMLAPLVMFVLCFYSYTKRFTSFAHLVLGLALALAPGGVWYALTAEFALEPMAMMFGVLFWVAGFDILYSCQDYDFDRSEQLFSIPAKVGLARAFIFAQGFHVLAILLFVLNGLVFDLGISYYIALGIFSYCLLSQYLLIKPDNLAKINQAFFSKNAQASIVLFLGVVVDYLL